MQIKIQGTGEILLHRSPDDSERVVCSVKQPDKEEFETIFSVSRRELIHALKALEPVL